jgi:hypothetical protein
MRELWYRPLRGLAHLQLLSLVFAVVVIVAWVQWRTVIGELKLAPWAGVIFLALVFRPAIVDLLRRTDKISTSFAQLSTKQLEEDVEGRVSGGDEPTSGDPSMGGSCAYLQQ